MTSVTGPKLTILLHDVGKFSAFLLRPSAFRYSNSFKMAARQLKVVMQIWSILPLKLVAMISFHRQYTDSKMTAYLLTSQNDVKNDVTRPAAMSLIAKPSDTLKIFCCSNWTYGV